MYLNLSQNHFSELTEKIKKTSENFKNISNISDWNKSLPTDTQTLTNHIVAYSKIIDDDMIEIFADDYKDLIKMYITMLAKTNETDSLLYMRLSATAKLSLPEEREYWKNLLEFYEKNIPLN